MAPEISVVVPLHNERENVVELHARLAAVLSDLGRSHEIVLVDDGSTDDTHALLSSICDADPHVTAVRLRRNFGQTAALTAGFDHSEGEIVVALDGDLQDHPEDIPRFLAKLEEGFDLVSGWRRQRAENLVLRQMPSRVANWLMAKLSRVPLHDFGTTFKAYRRDVIDDLELYGELHRFIPALASPSGIRITEIETRHSPRSGGSSHYGIGRTLRVFLDLLVVKFLISYSAKPLQFFGAIGLLLSAVGFLVALLLTGRYYFGDLDMHQNLGNLIFAMLCIVVGVQLIAIGLSLELSSRIYHRVNQKKIYSVESIRSAGTRR
jgi:glycosyltransferase involved in cell wall biosynthesis